MLSSSCAPTVRQHFDSILHSVHRRAAHGHVICLHCLTMVNGITICRSLIPNGEAFVNHLMGDTVSVTCSRVLSSGESLVKRILWNSVRLCYCISSEELLVSFAVDTPNRIPETDGIVRRRIPGDCNRTTHTWATVVRLLPDCLPNPLDAVIEKKLTEEFMH